MNSRLFTACCSSSDKPAPLLKTCTFAVLHFSIAFCVAYLLTGSILTGGLIALVEPACNTVAFYFHERIWSRFGVSPNREVGLGHGNLLSGNEEQDRAD
ncbi:DUF2061 domain-containing protein [Pseudomonas nitroreducens]|uniref:DUF2061 domain-containing protein n=1 Tax=Pseudomonas TaxID=286 RepID=UPI000378C19A|nr:DUF2061 domain-containing protein [Pseudomonas nitroreducens]